MCTEAHVTRLNGTMSKKPVEMARLRQGGGTRNCGNGVGLTSGKLVSLALLLELGRQHVASWNMFGLVLADLSGGLSCTKRYMALHGLKKFIA